jgi:hypothetical protein
MDDKPLNKYQLVAPCGINCSVCRAYLRRKNTCPGCRKSDDNKPITRFHCKIKNCNDLKNNNIKFCYMCKLFPCDKIKNLNRRYVNRYNMSIIENLENISKIGIRKFLLKERVKWRCIKCGGIICVHNRICSNCKEKF